MRGLVAAAGLFASAWACSYNGQNVGGGDDVDPSVDAPEVTIDGPVFPVIDAPVSVIDASPTAPDAFACPPGYDSEFEGHRYKIRQGTWYEAEIDCEDEGTHLIVIDSLSELVAYDLVTIGDVWVGMSDHVTEGTFRWLTNNSVVGGGWDSGEPNDGGGDEDCGSFTPGLGGGYNDRACSTTLTYACECDGLAALPASWCVTDQDTACEDCADDCTDDDEECVNHVCADS